MRWTESGNVRTIFLEGVIPLVFGISLFILSLLYCLGILKFRCVFSSCIDDQVAPAVIIPEQGGNRMTLAAAEKAYGPVACQAQLYGMNPQERLAVLESVLTPWCSTHQRLLPTTTRKASFLMMMTPDMEATTATNNERNTNNNNSDSSESSGGDKGGLDTSCACAICLREYGT
jgi:hypothetical protein